MRVNEHGIFRNPYIYILVSNQVLIFYTTQQFLCQKLNRQRLLPMLAGESSSLTRNLSSSKVTGAY